MLSGIVSAMAQTDSLQQKRYAIDEVVITGSRNETDLRHLLMTVTIIDRQQIENSFQPSLLPILSEQVPGLFITSRGIMGYGVSDGSAGGMNLRGIGGTNTAGMLVLIDGHPQYMGLMGHPVADAYQSMLAERVEVLHGPASVLYGSNAMGGVINIVTRKIREDGIKTSAQVGYGSYNTFQSEATSLIRKGRFSSVVAASYNQTDGHRDNMEFEQYSGYLKLQYDFSNHWKAYADVDIVRYNASNPGTVDVPMIDNDSRITRGMASLALLNSYGKTSGGLSFFYNWGRHKINDGYEVGDEPIDDRYHSKDDMLGISWYQNVELFEGNRVTVGFDYQHFGGEAWSHYLSDGHNENLVDKRIDDFAGYLDFRQNLAQWLTLNAGVRVDRHSQTGTEWIPQGGLSFHLPREAELKAVVSKGYRNPTIREMYMFTPRNPDLKPEKLMNYELSYTQKQKLFGQNLAYGANLYYIKGDNVIITDRSTLPPQNINSGEIENWGTELTLSYRFSPSWMLSTNYSWLHMEHPVIAAPEHKWYAGLTFAKNRWMATTSVQYVHGLYTVVSDTAEEKESFFVWNARVAYQVCDFARFYIKGENLLAQDYEINDGYPMPRATVMAGVKIDF